MHRKDNKFTFHAGSVLATSKHIRINEVCMLYAAKANIESHYVRWHAICILIEIYASSSLDQGAKEFAEWWLKDYRPMLAKVTAKTESKLQRLAVLASVSASVEDS